MVARRFNVAKFKSYSPDVLGSLPDDKHERSTKHLEIDKKNKLSKHWELAGGQLMTVSHSSRASNSILLQNEEYSVQSVSFSIH